MPDFEIRPDGAQPAGRDLYVVPPGPRTHRRFWRLYIGGYGAGIDGSRLCYQADKRAVYWMARWVMTEATC